MIDLAVDFGFYVVPLILILIITCGIYKKVPIFDTFLQGAEGGFKVTISLIPTFIGLIVGVSMLKASGALDIFAKLIEPLCSFFGVPSNIVPLAIMKPISGSGSTALLDNIFLNYGPDSLTGIMASMIAGSTETTFYTMAVYFGSVKIAHTRHALFCALTTNLFAIILAIVFAKFFALFL
ncbi:MAG: spore maturation protein [Acutalibacteraceae bacterium]